MFLPRFPYLFQTLAIISGIKGYRDSYSREKELEYNIKHYSYLKKMEVGVYHKMLSDVHIQAVLSDRNVQRYIDKIENLWVKSVLMVWRGVITYWRRI